MLKISPKVKTWLHVFLTLILVVGTWYGRGYVDEKEHRETDELLLDTFSELRLNFAVNLLNVLRSKGLERGIELAEMRIDSDIVYLDGIYSEIYKKDLSPQIVVALEMVQDYRAKNPRVVEARLYDSDEHFAKFKTMAAEAQKVLQAKLPEAFISDHP